MNAAGLPWQRIRAPSKKQTFHRSVLDHILPFLTPSSVWVIFLLQLRSEICRFSPNGPLSSHNNRRRPSCINICHADFSAGFPFFLAIKCKSCCLTCGMVEVRGVEEGSVLQPPLFVATLLRFPCLSLFLSLPSTSSDCRPSARCYLPRCTRRETECRRREQPPWQSVEAFRADRSQSHRTSENSPWSHCAKICLCLRLYIFVSFCLFFF